MKISNGDRVRDRITGFEGIVIGRTEWLNGCVRLGVEAEKLNEKGEPVEEQWLDEQRLLLLAARPESQHLGQAVSPVITGTAGGPQKDPRF